MNANPFTFGNPIRDPSRFYGRQQEIRQIVGRLLSSAHESTSIVGERRIGKTSLLNHLAHPAVAPTLGLPPDTYCLVYIDFQGLTDITPQRFWQRVLSKAARAACQPEMAASFRKLADQGEFDLFDLEDLFQGVGDPGLNVVLLMDEFEYVTQNPNFGPDFFGGLRALAIHHNLSLVPATRRELVDLCHSDEIKGSPFFNIFANVVLRPLARVEVDQMVDGYLGGTEMTLTPDEKEMILTLAGGHPFFVQMAGYYLFEAKVQGLRDEALKSSLVEAFAQQADSHFSYLWSHCSESEKITLLAAMGLAHQKPSAKMTPTQENLARLHPRAAIDIPALVKRGLLVPADATFAVFSPSFEYWMGREIAATPQEAESEANVEKWLAEGGRDKLRPVKGFLPKFKKKYWPVIGEVMKEISFEFVAGVVLSRIL